MSLDPLEVAAILIALGDQPSEELPGLATDALVRGLDSPALRQAAGSSPNDPREAADLFRTALEELGITAGDEQEALWALARHVAGQILTGERSPYEAAVWIWRHVCYRLKESGDLRVFVGLASECDDHPDDRQAIEAAIVDQARDLVVRDRPRTWVRVQAGPGAGPLWDSTSAALDLSQMRVSATLRGRLVAWQQQYEEILSDGGFASASAAKVFVASGAELVELLQGELGGDWVVEYMPEPVAPPGLRLRS